MSKPFKPFKTLDEILNTPVAPYELLVDAARDALDIKKAQLSGNMDADRLADARSVADELVSRAREISDLLKEISRTTLRM